nr:hypothetical protein [Bathymodiolus japonicus methanotrophic gill symbiont]
MCSVCGGRRAAGASPIRCVGERITATGVPEFREVAWRACYPGADNKARTHYTPNRVFSVYRESGYKRQKYFRQRDHGQTVPKQSVTDH